MAVKPADGAAVAGNHETEREELGRAFDLVSDARNHVYSVDFYVVDVTLLADSTLGEALSAKLAIGSRMNLLATGQQIEQIARDFFSSRRRHTRLQGDWSSDVCSSD